MNFKSIIFSTITFLSCLSYVQGQSLKSRLIHGYSFDNHVNSFNRNNETLTAWGAIFTTDRFGSENLALEIDHKTDGIDMPTIGDDTVSVSLWYYYKETGIFWNTLFYAPNNHHHLLIGYKGEFDDEIGYWDSATGFFSSGVKLVENTWYHIILVMADSSYTLYLNGEEITHSDRFFGNGNWPMTYLGNFNIEGGSQGSLGKLDDVYFFRGVLNQAEIDTLVHIGLDFSEEEVDTTEVTTDTLTIELNENLEQEPPTESKKPVIIYELITPNNDGKNDVFFIDQLPHEAHMEVIIFDTWGEVVYSNLDYDNTWSGGNLSSGNYFYALKVNNENYKGPLVIRR